MTAWWVDMMQSSGGYVTMKKCEGGGPGDQTWSKYAGNYTIAASRSAKNPFNGDQYPPSYVMNIVQHDSYYQKQGQVYLLANADPQSAPVFSVVAAGYEKLQRFQIRVNAFGVTG